MCGLAGIIAPAERLSHGAVEKMLGRQRHRGPDDYGIETIAAGAGVCQLGSCRLAIIDLSQAGHMPMADHETGNWLVYNGEIYNFRELRKELEASGERFYSGTDTEVILKAYRHWGDDCVHRLRGMFAFALWDHVLQELFLVRDRLGKKPLYYYQDAESSIFLFASEVRALLASGLVEPHLNPSALGAFLFNGFVVSPQTMIKDVQSLLPGYYMRVGCQGNIITMARYWSLPSESAIKPPNPQWQEEIRAELAQAVKLRLVSDVPLGAFLSGGMDSSTIVALMAQSASEVRTFSISFDEPAYDESPFSRWVAQRFGTVHSEIRLDKESFQSQVQDALLCMDQPTFDGVNTYCVARAAKESGLTVALSGLGADEIFGGYPFFKSIPWLFRMGLVTDAIPQVLRRLIIAWLGRRPLRLDGFYKTLELIYAPGSLRNNMRGLAAYQTAQLLYPQWSTQRLIAAKTEPEDAFFGLNQDFLKFIQEDVSDDELMSQISKATLRLFLGERCLRDSDAMSMGVSLEIRAPFTDHLFLSSACRVPGRLRCKGVPNKPFEWELVRPYLGDDYPLRRKQGFIFPFEAWLRDKSIWAQICDVLTNQRLAKDLGLDAGAIQAIIDGFSRSSSPIPWSRVWCLFVLMHWCEQQRSFLC